MSTAQGLRDRKKAQTRQAISNIATRLFIEHGFENVSVAEIAREAAVARKTVFNYFPRKEDLVFDREEEGLALVEEALASRGGRSPLKAFQALVRHLLDTDHPLFRIDARPVEFWKAVGRSPALKARACELQVSLADDLAALLAATVGGTPTDPDARLAAAMLMTTLVVAYEDALHAFGEQRDPRSAFATALEKGFKGVDAALAGSAYA